MRETLALGFRELSYGLGIADTGQVRIGFPALKGPRNQCVGFWFAALSLRVLESKLDLEPVKGLATKPGSRRRRA